ncbi:hypothetical protein AZ270_gp02 [Acidianus tailed spindle virus]|uniref:hypothetical protein n=1 Tax=Acidianus tailed spindle virus TaxID=1797140 RepID=UPI00076F3005|nr:hypothetical protein AZ270_gp02 [Acidianus tailed spindle virus]AME30025.1 hypothetical protein ATSV_A144 [Acidianus tailed spindle virus]
MAEVNSKSKYGSCLIITRHKLLPAQEEDLRSICDKIEIKPELPTNPQELQKVVEPYNTIVGSFPIQLQVEVLKNKKALIVFAMESLGVFETKEEAEQKASQYQGRTAILTPSKEGEKFRVTLYQGLKRIVEIKVIDEWLIQHSS